MGKIKFDQWTDGNEAEIDSASGFYDGPVPPGRKIYRLKVRRMELGKAGPDAKNPGAPKILVLLECQTKKSHPDAQYDGYGFFHNLNVTKQGAPFVNQFLDALAQGDEEAATKLKKDFWGGNAVVDGDGEGHVIRIGSKKINSPDGEQIVYALTKRATWNGNEKLEVVKFLWPAEKEYEGLNEFASDDELEELPEDLAEEAPQESSPDDETMF